MSIHQRIVAILSDLPAIAKTEKAPANMGGYSFRGIANIVGELKPLLAKHGVFIVPVTLERKDSERTVGNQRDKVMFCADVHVRWRFYAEDGTHFAASTWGQGTDMGDKAPQKAYTSAFKSMLSEVFCIADSETDSERHEVPETQRQLDWFQENGWENKAKHDEARQQLLDLLTPSSEVVKDGFKKNWDLSKALTADQMTQAKAWVMGEGE